MNFCWLHDIREQAVADGHDVLLEGGMGNATLSWGGEGALLEWLRRGRFSKLVPVLMGMAKRPRSLAWSVFNLLLIPALAGAGRHVVAARAGRVSGVASLVHVQCVETVLFRIS
jgi:hypothetical protein